MVSLAHIAGIPVEETALALAPVAAVVGGVSLARLRGRFGRVRARAQRPLPGSLPRRPFRV